MPHPIRRFCLFLLLFILVPAVFAASLPIPKPPSTGAKSYLLQDFHSHRTLAEKASDEPVEPASITKLMTAYIIFSELAAGNIALDEMVTVSEKAWRTPGSRMFIEVGKQVSVEDLLKGMIIQSGNDATVALAEHVAGSEETFAALMNQRGEEIGLTGSHFMNTTGLPDPQHYMTARDIALVAERVILEHPEYYKWYSEKEFTFNEITQYNRNKLLWRDDSVDGIKTGHTDSAGYCLVTSAERDGMRLITVVLGTGSENARAKASQSLLNYGFRFYETRMLYDAGSKLSTTRVWKGASDTLQVGILDPLHVTVQRGKYKSLDATMIIDTHIIAPVEQGQVLGSVRIKLGDEIVSEQPLIAMDNIAEGSFWQRIVDEALLYLD